MDDAAEEGDIRPRPQWGVDVAQSEGAGEPRIDMYEGRPALLRLQCKRKAIG